MTDDGVPGLPVGYLLLDVVFFFLKKGEVYLGQSVPSGNRGSSGGCMWNRLCGDLSGTPPWQ